MKHRAKVLRDTNAGPGLLSIDGKQHPFSLEAHWRSDVPPRVGMVVDAELDDAGSLLAAMPVADGQVMKEQAEQALKMARARGGQWTAGLTARFGAPLLVAMAALGIGWFVLNTVVVQLTPGMRIGMSFWKLLALLNSPASLVSSLSANAASGGGGGGIYALLCILAFAGPFAPFFWKDRRAHLCGLLPLAFMLVTAVLIYAGIQDGLAQTREMVGGFGGQQARQMAEAMGREMMKQVWNAVSLGLGFYVSLIASLYLAARAGVHFLAART